MFTTIYGKFRAFFNFNKKEWISSLLLAFTIFFFAPTSILLFNASKMSIGFYESALLYIGVSLLGFLLFLTIGIIFNRKKSIIPALYYSLSICFWIQGNLIVYDIGQLDGHIIEWGQFNHYIVIEALIWGAGILSAIFLRKKINRNLVFLTGLLFIIQIAQTTINAIQQSNNIQRSNEIFYFDTSTEFQFSAKQNVVIIILDTFWSDAFNFIIENDPQYGKQFRDFTYFTDTLGGYPTTYPSVPLLLTGNYYQNNEPIRNFIENSYKTSLPFLLKETGYNIEEYSMDPFVFSKHWDNATSNYPFSEYLDSALTGYTVTFIRYSPLKIKQFFIDQYYNGYDYYHKDTVELYKNAQKTSKSDIRPVFKFIHLPGAHPPFSLDENLNKVQNSNYLLQAKASLQATLNLVDNMKRAGVYDNSLILIMGDHGANRFVSLENMALINPMNSRLYVNDEVLYASRPLLLIKPINAQNDNIVYSSKPVSLADIPRTVSDLLNIKNNFSGYSMFGEIPNDRVRNYYHYFWERSGWLEDYLPVMYPFEIQGNSTDPNSWAFSDEKLSGESVEKINVMYTYGENIVETLLQNDESFLVMNGRNPYINLDHLLIHKDGTSTCINLPIEKTNQSLLLKFEGGTFPSDEGINHPPLDIYIDGDFLNTISLNSKFQTIIEDKQTNQYTSDQQVQVCLVSSSNQGSAESQSNKVYVEQGYYFSSISLVTTVGYSLPYKTFFTTKQNEFSNPNITLTGFLNPETEFTWINGTSASIQIPVLTDKKDLILNFSVYPFLIPGELDNHILTVSVNGKIIDKFNIDHEQDLQLAIPSNNIQNSMITVTFDIPSAAPITSFEKYKNLKDNRVLGLALKWLEIREKP